MWRELKDYGAGSKFEGGWVGAAFDHVAETLPLTVTPTRAVGARSVGNVIYLGVADPTILTRFSNVSAAYLNVENSEPSLIDALPVQKTIEDKADVEKRRPYSQISEFRKLKDDWDGYGSVAPSAEVLHLAVRLLDVWNWELGVVPDLSVLSGGEVSFELFSDDCDLLGVVDLYDDGKLSYALSIDGVGNNCGLLELASQDDRGKLFELIGKAKKSV
ncbi:hypothetical protein [Arenibacterium sp. LLYu02]|uniref:hypothetical protein n=1 Tax=Arenibacterium sp. LLYu02 TaxID=3404132 RepID=UPI003B20BA6A